MEQKQLSPSKMDKYPQKCDVVKDYKGTGVVVPLFLSIFLLACIPASLLESDKQFCSFLIL